MPVLGVANLALISSLFDHLPENPFFIKDAGLRYVAANSALARLCGLADSGQILGRTARDLFPHDLAQRYERLDRRILAGGQPIHDQLELTGGRRGESAWLLFSRYPVRDGSGQVVGIAAVSRRLSSAARNHPIYLRIAQVTDQIRSNFDRPLDLSGLAVRAGVSRSQLERDFSRLLGTTMQSFLNNIRMERAAERLSGQGSIAEIAQDCGYSDQSAFTRRFRAAFGLSPTAYRRRLGA